MGSKIIIEGIKYPKQLAVGSKGKGVLVLFRKGGKKKPENIIVVVNNKTYELLIGKNETKVLEFEVSPGVNNIKIFRDNELIEELQIDVKPIYPVINIEPEVNQYINLDKPSIIKFRISDNGVPYKIAEVNIEGTDLEASATVTDKILLVSVKPLAPKELYTFNLKITYLDLDNNLHEYSGSFIIKSQHEKFGVLEDYIKTLAQEIDRLIHTSSMKELDIISVLEDYYNITSKCVEFNRIIGYDPCDKYNILSEVILSQLDDELPAIMNTLDSEKLTKIKDLLIETCIMRDSSLCKMKDVINGYIEFINKINSYLNDLKYSSHTIYDISDILAKIVDLCQMHDLNLNICIRAREKMNSMTNIMKKYTDSISKLREDFNIKINNGLIPEAEEIFNKIQELCRIAGYEINVCKGIDSLKNTLNNIRALLENINVETENIVPYDWFEASITISNNTGIVINNLYINLSEAQHFFEFSRNIDITKISMPPIYPGSEIKHVVLMKPKFFGKITVPYKVCLGNYCIDKNFIVNIEKPEYIEKTVSKTEKEIPPRPIEKIAPEHIMQQQIVEARRIVESGPHGFVDDKISLINQVASQIILSLRLREINARNMPFREITFGDLRCNKEISVNKTKAVLVCRDSLNREKVVKIPLNIYEKYRMKLPITIEHDLEAFNKYLAELSSLKHENIVKYLYEKSSIPIIVEELCIYGDLQSTIRYSHENPMKPDKVVKIMLPIISAISYLHLRNPPIVHGNISLTNILINHNYMPKITDIALYKSGIFKPKIPPYMMAPEQVAENLDEPLPQTDVWQIGTLMYYLLTLRHPYPIFHNKPDYSRTPPPLYFENPDVPKKLDEIIRKAISKNIDDRYKNAYEMFKETLNLAEEIELK